MPASMQKRLCAAFNAIRPAFVQLGEETAKMQLIFVPFPDTITKSIRKTQHILQRASA